MSKNTLIGKVKSVTGNRVSVQLDDRIPSSMPVLNGRVYSVGQIGSFLKIPMGFVYLFGIVTQTGAEAIPESIRLEGKGGLRWLTLVLVGERIGDRFERGVGQYPTSDNEVHLVTEEDLNLIYHVQDESSSITVGHISSSESLPARLDINKLVTRHSAILGSTGSGKSNAVTVLLRSIAEGNFPSARILLVDPHGEYSSALEGYSRVYRINAVDETNAQNLFVPFWALPFDEIIKAFIGKLSESQEEYLREKIYHMRVNSLCHIENAPDESAMSADSPIPFSMKKLWYELDRFERTTFSDQQRQNEFLEEEGEPNLLKSARFAPATTNNTAPFQNMKAKGISRFLEQMRNRLVDKRFDFLFHPGDWEPDLDGRVSKDLDDLLAGWLGHERPITILDLSGVPAEILPTVSGAVIRIVYDALLWGQNLPVGGRKQPLLIVLEEAHSYLQTSEHSVASRTVRSIAKEGRKYGVGLLLVTQRPSELDTTVLSQCGTTIALRMTNSQDRNHVQSVVQDDLTDIMSLMPSLRTGEGLVVGEAVHIPSRVRFDPAPRAPKSSDPMVTDSWSSTPPNNYHYKEAVALWRHGRFHVHLQTKED